MKTFITSLFVVFIVSFSCYSQDEKSTETTTYYLIRHAEKDRSDASNKDPKLTKEGIARAENWSQVLSNVNFDMIYSTDYNRTKATAKPTAIKNNIEVIIYNPKTMDGEAFMKATMGKTVLIVGHSNTTPLFANALLGEQKFKSIDDSNNGNLYIITINGKVKAGHLLTIN